MPYLIQRQVGGDDQRLSAEVSAIDDIVPASNGIWYQILFFECRLKILHFKNACWEKSQTLELHPLDAGCVIASPNDA